jgi:hypothetical protein
LGRKVSDEFIVPICRAHHRELHRHGDEASWWQSIKLDPLPIARRLWQRERFNGDDINGNMETPTPPLSITTDAADMGIEPASCDTKDVVREGPGNP